MPQPLFEELDYRPTPIGALILRRRRELRLDGRAADFITRLIV